MRRVSSLVRIDLLPAAASFPPISTSGGLPGVKKRSLIFLVFCSMAVSRAGVEKGVGAAAAPAGRGADGTIFGAPLVGEDIGAVTSFGWGDERFSQVRA